MNGQRNEKTVRSIKEVIDYQALLRTALEATDSQAMASIIEALSAHGQTIILEVLKSFAANYQMVMNWVPERLRQHEYNQRWKKLLGFPSFDELSRKAWDNTYREVEQLTGLLLKQHLRLLAKAVAGHSVTVNQAAQVLMGLLNNQQRGLQRFLPSGER